MIEFDIKLDSQKMLKQIQVGLLKAEQSEFHLVVTERDVILRIHFLHGGRINLGCIDAVVIPKEWFRTKYIKQLLNIVMFKSD